MEDLQKCWERAELLLETARQRPNKIRILSSNSNNSGKWRSIHQKLTELYVEECSQEPKQKHLRNASHLLDKLVTREKISCLLVNLYPGNEGYSVMLKGRSGMDTETVRLPYEEAELLQYIDNEELPPVLVDILESSQVNIFYSGCIVAEVRDYRRSASPTIFESHHVLLRPSMQTLICDVNSLTSDGSKWSHEDKMALESHILLATQEPLCLEPSVAVAYVSNYIQYSKYKFCMTPMKQVAKKFSQTAINRKWKFEQHAAPPNLSLYDFLAKRKDKKRNQPAINLRLGKPGVNLWKQREVKLSVPEEIDVAMYAISIPAPLPSNNHLEFVEEYILESKQGNGKGYYCRLTISQRMLDDIYIGELYTDRNYLDGVPGGGTCWFEFRTQANVNKYLHQFIDIFTQESRKAVKISHKVNGHETVVRTIPGGQSVVFPLSSVASIAMGELANPVLKRMPSFSKPLMSPTSISSMPVATTADHAFNTGTTLTSSAVVSPGTGGQCDNQATSRQSSAGSCSLSRSSSLSPVPVASSPSHCVSSQITAVQCQQKMNPTPPPNSRTPTPTPQPSKTGVPTPPPPLTPVPTPSPPTPVSALRRQQTSDVVTSLGFISRIQSNLAGFLNSGTSEIATGLAPAPVSLAGVAVPQGIAVPISLAMMGSSQPSLIVSPIPNLVTHSSCPQPLSAGTPTSPPTQSAGGTFTTTNSIPSSAIVVTTAMLTPSVLTAPSGIMSFPVGIGGSLTAQNLAARLLASGLNRPAVGIHSSGGPPFGLLQVTGSQSTTASPVFPSGSTQRSVPVKPGNVAPHALPKSTTPPATVTTPPPTGLATVGSTLMTFGAQHQQLHLALQQSQHLASFQLQHLRHQQGSSSHAGQQKGKGRKRAATSPK